MPLNLTHLATFVRLASDPSFTRTAAARGLTQPAITHQVRALERELGLRLVDVVARRATITEAGAYLADRARTVLSAAEALERDMRELALTRTGTIHLGATLTIGSTVLPEILARFREAHPNVDVQVEIANTATMVESVLEGRLSVALIEGTVSDDRLRIEPFRDDELLVIAPPGHRLANRRRIPVRELARETFVGREPGSGTRALLEQAFAAHGISVQTTLAIPSGEGIVRAVACGLGIAALSRLVVADAIAAGSVVALHVPSLDLRRALTLVVRRLRTASPAVVAFRRIVLG